MQLAQGKNPQSHKFVYIEAMRILAIIFVIFNHTNTTGFVHFVRHEPGDFLFWLNLFFAVFCKFGVSLFFMISGAMMLRKPQQPIKTTIKNKVLKYFLILCFFSAFYAFSDHILLGTEIQVNTFFTQLYSSNLKYQLWYLYAYIAFLILMPVLKSWCQNMEDKHFIYIIVIHFIYRMITIIQYFLFNGKTVINTNIVPSLPMNIVVLPMIGYFVENRIKIETVKKFLAPLWLLNIICIGLCCYTTYIKGLNTGTFSEKDSQTFFSTFTFINSMTIYLTIKYLFNRIRFSEYVQRVICYVGSLCFGIYLFHPLFKDMPYMKPWLSLLNNSGVPHVCIIIIYVLCMLIPAGVLTVCIRKAAKIL